MPKSVEELIKSGSDDEKISRIRYLENESQSMLAYGLDANDTPAAWETTRLNHQGQLVSLVQCQGRLIHQCMLYM